MGFGVLIYPGPLEGLKTSGFRSVRPSRWVQRVLCQLVDPLEPQPSKFLASIVISLYNIINILNPEVCLDVFLDATIWSGFPEPNQKNGLNPKAQGPWPKTSAHAEAIPQNFSRHSRGDQLIRQEPSRCVSTPGHTHKHIQSSGLGI